MQEKDARIKSCGRNAQQGKGEALPGLGIIQELNKPRTVAFKIDKYL